MSPFQALYGRPPPVIPDFLQGSTTNMDLEHTLQQQQEILNTVKTNLKKTRQRMETQANKHRLDYTFNVGDWVLLRLHPYRQKTVARRTSQKLAKRYFGPYTIRRRIGKVAYELDLPPSAKIHPVVHMSLLRPYLGDNPSLHFKPIPESHSHSTPESQAPLVESVDFAQETGTFPLTKYTQSHTHLWLLRFLERMEKKKRLLGWEMNNLMTSIHLTLPYLLVPRPTRLRLLVPTLSFQLSQPPTVLTNQVPLFHPRA